MRGVVLVRGAHRCCAFSWQALLLAALLSMGLLQPSTAAPCPPHSFFLHSFHHKADHCACIRTYTCVGSMCTHGSDANLPRSYAAEQQGFPFACKDCFCIAPDGSTDTAAMKYRWFDTTDGDRIRDFHDPIFEASCNEAPVTKPIPKPKALPYLTWLHFPKCGSSFTNVFYNYGCRDVEGSLVYSDLQDPLLPHYKEHTCEYCHNPCKGCFTLWAPHDGLMRTRKKGTYLRQPFREKYCAADKRGYIPGHNALSPSRARQRSGTIAAIFRDPRTRLVSAYNYRKHTFGMNSLDRKLLLPTTHTLEAFANFPGVHSCQTKMLIGKTCAQYFDLTPDHLEQAKSVVENDLALAGVLEHWNASVCLFHRKFGGRMHVSETANLRPTKVAVDGVLGKNNEARKLANALKQELAKEANKFAQADTEGQDEKKSDSANARSITGGRKTLGYLRDDDGDGGSDDASADDDGNDDGSAALNNGHVHNDDDDKALLFDVSYERERAMWDSYSEWEEVEGIKDQVSKTEYLKVTRAHEPNDWELYEFVEAKFFQQLDTYGLMVPTHSALDDSPQRKAH